MKASSASVCKDFFKPKHIKPIPCTNSSSFSPFTSFWMPNASLTATKAANWVEPLIDSGLLWPLSSLEFIASFSLPPSDAASRARAALSPIDTAMVTEIDTSTGLHILEFHGGSMVGTVIILIVIAGILYFLRSCLVHMCRRGMGMTRRQCPPLPLWQYQAPPPASAFPPRAQEEVRLQMQPYAFGTRTSGSQSPAAHLHRQDEIPIAVP